MSQVESEALLQRVLDYLQRDRRVRFFLAAALVVLLVGLAGRSLYGLVPRQYVVTMTGGDIVTNRHYLARILEAEARKVGITLVVKPVRGTFAELEAVSEGKVDLALVQGGLDVTYPNVEHVATVLPEPVHVLVKPGISGMADLRGRSVNLGPKGEGVLDIGLVLTRFAGYKENVDFVETNYGDEALLALPPDKMPDVIFTISSVPSYLVEILVRRYHYDVVEIPFPEALALRHGWVANGQILAYTYNLSPAVPAKNIVTVAVNMHLLASTHANPAAVEKLLEVLFSPAVSSRLRLELDDKRITVPSGYPISAGLTAYLHRNDSLITLDTWNKIQSSFGLLMSFAGMLIVLVRWFRGAGGPAFDDADLHGWLVETAEYERQAAAMEAAASIDRDRATTMRQRLGELNADLMARYPTLRLEDAALFDRCVGSVRQVHAHLDGLLARPT